MSVIALVGHFRVERELLREHVIGAPTESPGKRVARADAGTGVFSETIHVDAEAHVDVWAE